MKKAFAYATIAALLGIAVMLAPFLTIPAITSMTPNSQTQGKGDSYGAPAPISFSQIPLPANTQAEATRSEQSAGITPNYPVDLTAIAFILVVSLAVAFSAYFYTKRNRSFASRNMMMP